MIDVNSFDVEILEWQEARQFILDKELLNIIDELSPNDNYKFFKARYPFGTKIIEKNAAYLPLKNKQTISFNDPSLPKLFREHLSYNPDISNPVAMVLDKSSEFHLSIGTRILPYAIVKPGHLFGLSRIIDQAESPLTKPEHLSFFLWELTSGARSLFLLPKVTQQGNHIRLRKTFGLQSLKPNNYQEQFYLFREIIQKANVDWHSEFLFFSNKWFENLHDPAWGKLYNYFLRKNRSSYEYWHNMLSWQIVFSTIEQDNNLLYSSLTLNTAKHLFGLATQAFLGFIPAVNNDAAPIDYLQQAYVEHYGLNNYWPVFMHPESFSIEENNSIYYSLNYPTLPQYEPNTFKGRSVLTLIDEVAYVTQKYIEKIKENPIALQSTLATVTEKVAFSYYHCESLPHSLVQNTKDIQHQDARLASFKHYHGEFPRASSFLNGCVQLKALS